MHIGIYINNENISSVDCKNLLAGNPGIGGTEYCVLLLAQVYKMYYSNNKVTLFVAKQGILPEVDNYVVVNGIDDLPAKAQKEDVDVLVVSAVYNGIPLPQSFFDDISAKKIKTILWGHNFYLISVIKFANANMQRLMYLLEGSNMIVILITLLLISLHTYIICIRKRTNCTEIRYKTMRLPILVH